jgi:environmental stress-induced protein Ves
VTGALPGGPVSDFNVIFDPRHCTARLSVMKDAPPERRAACADLLIINLAAAPMECAVEAARITLDRHDAIWIASPAAFIRCRGVTRAAIVEIDPAPAA